tara:strand:- start:849 stop:1421 length:573 start_codon:yes stop_codon:yes gene_type:complete
MTGPLMPKSTAVWLIENTGLSFEQVAEFCGIHILEVQGIADGEVASGMQGRNPVASGELTTDEITRCEQNPSEKLIIRKMEVPLSSERRKGPRYTPTSKRQDLPDAISWVVKFHPELTDAQICRLIGTTKPTVVSIKNRDHWNISNVTPRDPVLLGICLQSELNEAVSKARKTKRWFEIQAERDEKKEDN